MISRNFHHKSVKENFCNFHTVKCIYGLGLNFFGLSLTFSSDLGFGFDGNVTFQWVQWGCENSQGLSRIFGFFKLKKCLNLHFFKTFYFGFLNFSGFWVSLGSYFDILRYFGFGFM